MSPSPLQLSAAAATSVGCVRQINEDRHLLDPARGWFAVADGIGGLPFGERASECAIRSLVREIDAAPPSRDGRSLADLVAACHVAVRQLGSMLNPRTGIGTTLTALHLEGYSCELAHVGDSVGFLHPGLRRPLVRLTIEHTVPSPRVAIAGPAPAFIPPARLDRYLGQPVPPRCDLHLFQVSPGDRLILCSDGVTHALDECELAAMSTAHAAPASLAQALVHVSDLRGGHDNATAVIIDLR